MSRIFDLGAVVTTATVDRADADLFKMSMSGNLALTFAGFQDGDVVTVSVTNTGGSSHSLTVTNAVVFEIGSGGISIQAGVELFVTFRCFNGAYLELNRVHA